MNYNKMSYNILLKEKKTLLYLNTHDSQVIKNITRLQLLHSTESLMPFSKLKRDHNFHSFKFWTQKSFRTYQPLLQHTRESLFKFKAVDSIRNSTESMDSCFRNVSIQGYQTSWFCLKTKSYDGGGGGELVSSKPEDTLKSSGQIPLANRLDLPFLRAPALLLLQQILP